MSTNGDNSLRIWSLTREDEKYHVSHTDEITCFVITADSLHVITGSRDMSLKVWQSTGGKLAQVNMIKINLIACNFISGHSPTGARRSFRCCTHRCGVCHKQEPSPFGIKGF
jgi:WD40 repeat protein